MGLAASGAVVTLLCSTGAVCGTTKTNSSGEFLFTAIPPGSYSVRVSHAVFYLFVEPDYRVLDGVESVYQTIALEQCPQGNCSEKARRKVVRICQ